MDRISMTAIGINNIFPALLAPQAAPQRTERYLSRSASAQAGIEERLESVLSNRVEGVAKPEDSADDTLVEAILAGDHDAFEKLMARHSRRVFIIARHFFRQAETIEDIAQETFAKAFLSLQTYRRGASFSHWLARIAVNNCYDELRRRKKRSESLLTEMSETDSVWLETTLAPLSFDQHLREEDRAKASEMTHLILGSLTPEDQLVLVLLHAEELSVREISALTGWSEAKVKIRAFRARQTARRAITRIFRKKSPPAVSSTTR
jgi:RNA polymerase sigma factor (sigma-70 family)